MSDSEATLATQIYQRLRSDLLSGQFAPSAKLKVRNIAADYGVGASPIREALSSLAAEGLVERNDQRGFRAAPATLAEFEEILEARCWLEELMLRESIANGGQDWEDAIVLNSYRLGRLRRDTPEADAIWQRTHRAYHDALLAACTSKTLHTFCNTLRERAARYRNIAKTIAYPDRDVVAEHEAITEAVLARNTPKACELLVEHYRTTAEYVRAALRLLEPHIDSPDDE